MDIWILCFAVTYITAKDILAYVSKRTCAEVFLASYTLDMLHHRL